MRHDIEVMYRQLDELNVPVVLGGQRCVTVSGNHHDFKTNRELYWYLMGVTEQAEIRARMSQKVGVENGNETELD